MHVTAALRFAELKRCRLQRVESPSRHRQVPFRSDRQHTAVQAHGIATSAYAVTALLQVLLQRPSKGTRDLSSGLMAQGLGPCSLAVPDNPKVGVVALDAHLAGFSQQFAGQTDACLLVEGQLFCVHSALLAVGSTVFSDIFSTAQAESPAAVTNKDAKLCVTMAGHTVSDTCTALEFLYQRSSLGLTDTPSKQLWQSVDKARPVINFAHKFDMKAILEFQ